MTLASLRVLTAADFSATAAPRWCPGCGDYAVLEQLKKTFANSGLAPDQIAVVGGVGCAGRTAQYLATHHLQALPGRAFAVALGSVLANANRAVWVVTGDSDATLGAGLIHLIRRNAHVKVVILNNEVGGLARGAVSPVARPDPRAPQPGEPLSILGLALAAGATFVARTVDVDAAHLGAVLARAHAHPGTAVVEVLQNCRVFHDEAWAAVTDRSLRTTGAVFLMHGQPIRCGDAGLQVVGDTPTLGPAGPDDWVHDETAEIHRAFVLARLGGPEFPTALGVLRAVRRPVFGDQSTPGPLTDLLAHYHQRQP